MADKTHTDPQRMEKIVSLCKRRGFIFQSGELYGGLNGCWDYGPLGAELKKNLKNYWWQKNVQERDDVLGMDGAILTHQAVLTASGHVGGFSDPMCTCKVCKKHVRADQLQDLISQSEWGISLAQVIEDQSDDLSKNLRDWVHKKGKKLVPSLAAVRKPEALAAAISVIEAMPEKDLFFVAKAFANEEVTTESTDPCPHCGGELTAPRQFNLMFQTNVGAAGDDIAYLRPETAQSIFVQYKNISDSSRVKLPFGIAQIGKAFRNEINPRNFTFRSREFEQMEIEYFCRGEDGLRLTDEWLEARLCFYEEIGIPREKLHILDIPDGERAFYSQKTYDIEYDFPFGCQELEGIAYRTNYDLSKHQEHSGKPLEYFDEETREKFLPHVVEPSAGCDRTVLALLCQAYDEEDLTDENGKSDSRIVMRFVPRMAPIKVAIFPLLKKNDEQVRISKEIQAKLRPWMTTFYDESGAVGRRYRRQDEVGTPFCITVDFDTLGENNSENKGTVTIRHRDSMSQERVAIDQLLHWFLGEIR